MAYSLTYSYDSASKSYTVTGWSDITTSDKVVIPSTYDDGIHGVHPVATIGVDAFHDCSNLTSVTIPNSVTNIDEGAFALCTSLINIIIPDSVTSLGSAAFKYCTSLKSVIMSNNLTSIGDAAFSECSSLINVTIPDSVMSIGDSTFSNCSNLTSVTIGIRVTSIGDSAFYNCSNLTSVVIPDSVTRIDNYAFGDCSSLTQLILFPSTPPTLLGSNAIPSNVQSIYVQQSSKAAYQAATNWTAFASKIVSDNLYLSFIRFNRKNKEYIDKKIQDNDITSLNVVDGTAADNQVELQITKQGAGGTIDGPAIVGKDGITINKAADSEKIEISGSGYVKQSTNTNNALVYARVLGQEVTRSLSYHPYRDVIPIYDKEATLRGNMGAHPAEDTLTNTKYVDDNYVKKVKFTNLEQALNGYILDTTKEAYADLDSAVLKNSVAVGDNVYPIADKTRALVTRIEGKTTKMVQVLDKSTFPATSTPTAGVTVTKTDDGGLHVLGTAASSGGRNSWGITVNVEKGHKYLSLLKGNNKITSPIVTLKSDTSQYVGFVADIVTSKIEGECYYGFNFAAEDYDETIYPQLFDLTAMGREDITTAEQFKAEFPEFYPYENGNIYPAKISGVKFTGKNLFNPSTPKYSGESGFELDGNNITVKQSNTSTYISANFELPNAKFLIGKRLSISAKCKTSDNNQGRIRVLWMRGSAAVNISGMDIISNSCTGKTETNLSGSGIVLAPSDDAVKLCLLLYSNTEGNLSGAKTYTATYSDIQVEISDAPTAYEPYTEPVSVTLPETYDLHGIGDYKDYLEITKNENNELYTLKKIQNIGSVDLGTLNFSYQSDKLRFFSMSLQNIKNVANVTIIGDLCCSKFITKSYYDMDMNFNSLDKVCGVYISPHNYLYIIDKAYTDATALKESLNGVMLYYALATPVETVIATNLTYEQVTAIRHNGGLIEVDGNTNKAYARPTVTNTIVYRLTAKNTAEG